MKKAGFTLVELLVVISIIAILSIIGLVAYGNFLKSSRNAKRQADLKFIQSALEDYHADQLSYPTALDILTSGSRKYMNQVPNDPKGGTPYGYETTANSYCLSANLEGTDPLDECNPAFGYNYGVTRP